MTETLKNDASLADFVGKPAEIRVFSEANSDGAEKELDNCRFPVRILGAEPGNTAPDDRPPLLWFEFLDHALIPLPAGRWLDLYIDGARRARIDVLHLTRREPTDLSSLVIHGDSQFKIGADA